MIGNTKNVWVLFLGAVVACSSADSSGAGGGGGGASSGSSGSSGSDGSDGGASADGGGGQDGATPPPGPKFSGKSWCDGASWPDGKVPTKDSDVVISAGSITVDCDAQARSIEIKAGAALGASRTKSATLTLTGNLVVRGTLDYGQPNDRIGAGVKAEIVFTGIDDEKFVGTPSTVFGGDFGPPVDVPMAILPTDVGVWVADAGKFTAAGELKSAWSKLTDGAGPGDATFTVEDATGWKAGDMVVLTPTLSPSDTHFATAFDEIAIASVSGNTITLAQSPTYAHAGCAGCMRRGEAMNMTRNAVVRSADGSGHAHILVFDKGVLQLDSAELRALGPQKKCSSSGPARRAPIYFHEQGADADPSFVRHTAIWKGKNHFLMIEKSHGVEVNDIAGYDTIGSGVALFFDSSACDTRCNGTEAFSPKNIVLTHVLSAKVAVPERADEGCAPLGFVQAIIPSGGEGSGVVDSVAVGAQYNADVWGNGGAIHFQEEGSSTPTNIVMNGTVAHNNGSHGISDWQNNSFPANPFDKNQSWSNGGNGFHHGAYVNTARYTNLLAADNAGDADFGIIATVGDNDATRLEHATVDRLSVLSYFVIPKGTLIVSDVTFTGVKNPAITQDHTVCTSGNGDDPQDAQCIRNIVRFVAPKVPKGTVPFDFGWTSNKFSGWEVRNFSHPDHPGLPANFDLFRKDNQVAGGSYYAAFDAWLVPR